MLKINPEFIPEPITNYIFWSHSSQPTKEEAIRNTSEIFTSIPVEAILCVDYACRKPNGCKFTIYIAKEFAPNVDQTITEIYYRLAILKELYL